MISPRAFLRLFPPAWRERYGDEMVALLEAAPPSRRDVAGILWLAAEEWMQTWAMIAPIAIAISIGSMAIGSGLRRIVDAPVAAKIVLLGCMLAYLANGFWRVRFTFRAFLSTGTWDQRARIDEKTMRAWLGVIFLWGVLSSWAGYSHPMPLFIEFGPTIPAFLSSPVFLLAISIQGWSVAGAQRKRESSEYFTALIVQWASPKAKKQ